MARTRKERLEFIASAVDRLSKPFGRMAKAGERLTKSISKPFRVLQRNARIIRKNLGIDKVAKSFRNLGSALGRLTTRVSVFTGGIFAAGAGLLGLTKRMATLGDQAAKDAFRLGLTAESLQELQFAADRSGISAEQLNGSLQTFTQNVGAAVQGTGDLVTLMPRLGITFRNSQGQLKGTEQLFLETADALGKIENEALRARIASQLFGGEGPRIAQLTAQGAKGIQALREEARKYGVISNEAAAQSEGLIDSFTNMTAALTGRLKESLTALFPVIQKLIDQFTTWIVANREVFAKAVERFAKDLPNVINKIGKAFQGLMQFISPLADTFSRFTEFVGGPGNAALTLLAGTFTALVLPALFATISAVVTLTGVIIANPIGAMAAAVIALGAAIVAINWDAFANDISAVVDFGKTVFNDFVDFFKNIFSGIGDYISDAFSYVGTAISNSLAPARNLLLGFKRFVKGVFGGDAPPPADYDDRDPRRPDDRDDRDPRRFDDRNDSDFRGVGSRASIAADRSRMASQNRMVSDFRAQQGITNTEIRDARVDINVNAPQGTQVRQRGTSNVLTRLTNTGVVMP